MVENGAKDLLGSTELLYLPRRLELVRQFEEKAVRTGRRSLIKDAQNYASELDLELVLKYPDPVGRTKEGEKIEKKKIGVWINKALVKVHQERTEEQKNRNGKGTDGMSMAR